MTVVAPAKEKSSKVVADASASLDEDKNNKMDLGTTDQAAGSSGSSLKLPPLTNPIKTVEEDDEEEDEEEDENKDLCRDSDHHCGLERPTKYKLCTYDESPAYLQHNPYVHTGYRVNFSFNLCVHSLFRLHNESWNIWTHLFGFAVFIWLGDQLLRTLEWRSPSELILFLAFILSVEASMLSSAIFHAFNCHSPCTYKWTCRFDYSSISLLLVGSYSPMLYYGFICEPFWQKLYLCSFMVLGVTGVVISFLPFFSTPQYRVYRTCVFLSLGWSTLMPLPHLLYAHGAWAVWQIARWELLVGLIYSVGAVIYAKRIPERWYPGKYDFSVMGSHSLWHLFTIAGALVQMHACIRVYEAFGTLVVCA